MTDDANKLTPAEVHAWDSLLTAVKVGNDEEARWWANRPSVLSALAKMRAQAKERSWASG